MVSRPQPIEIFMTKGQGISIIFFCQASGKCPPPPVVSDHVSQVRMHKLEAQTDRMILKIIEISIPDKSGALTLAGVLPMTS